MIQPSTYTAWWSAGPVPAEVSVLRRWTGPGFVPGAPTGPAGSAWMYGLPIPHFMPATSALSGLQLREPDLTACVAGAPGG